MQLLDLLMMQFLDLLLGVAVVGFTNNIPAVRLSSREKLAVSH